MLLTFGLIARQINGSRGERKTFAFGEGFFHLVSQRRGASFLRAMRREYEDAIE